MLADLRSYASTHPVPKADFLNYEGLLLHDCGRWKDGLESFEAAWQVHDGWGIFKEAIAEKAAYSCLKLGDFEGCSDWLKAMRGFRNPHNLRASVALKLAMARRRPYSEIARRHSEFLEHYTQIQARWASEAVTEMNVRVLLVDPTLGDPAANHPSLNELIRKPNGLILQSIFNRALMVLDYRLACLRWGAGLPPSEEEWAVKDPPAPKRLCPRDPQTLHIRLHKARTALKLVYRRAEALDTAFECDWRQAEVRKRERRIEQIAKAATASPKRTRSGVVGRRSVPKRKAG
jgi:hypothetical protein